MTFDFCFYRYNSSHLSQYPTLEYAKEVIFESLELTLPLHGKRQFSLIKRAHADTIRLYQIYNYIYNDNNDVFGICIVYHDKYPHDIEYMFKLCGATIAAILEEGKLLHLDSTGNIISDNKDLGNHYSNLNRHKVKFKDTILHQGTKLSHIPNNFYNNYEKQHVICQLSDKTWSLDEVFENNNIVVITEEIEDENINNMRSFVKRSNETVKILNEQVKRLQEQLRQAEREKQKYEKQVKQATKNTKQQNGADNLFAQVIIWGFIVTVLLCLIAPWFISSMSIWIKLALVLLTVLGTWGTIYAIDDDHKGKYVAALGWGGFLAILLSTFITGYGIFGGFNDNSTDSSVSVVNHIESREIDEKEVITKVSPKHYAPSTYVNISSGSSSFWIDKYEVTQEDYVRLMGNNPSTYTGDSLPVHGISVRDAVLYCNKKSEEDGCSGFYVIDGNTVTVKSDGNGYRLPTVSEWKHAANSSTANQMPERVLNKEKSYSDGRKYNSNRPHKVNDKNANRNGLYDLQSNVSELCVQNNGEIWGMGKNYRIHLNADEFKVAESLSSTIKTDASIGLRLVFVP